ncbi:MAG: aminoacyl-tRNA hydrolase [Nocardioidaceae bacterium]
MTYDGWVVVGLGNPGPTYAATRHNVGYLVTDELASRMGGAWKAHKSGRALAIEGRLAGLPGVRAVLGRPRSYMNESGGPVASLLTFYRSEPDRLVVIHDELDLPYGDLRVKFGGGDNGHNGLKSIRQSVKTGDYFRVRVGIGRPSGQQDAADFVLSPFSAVERRNLADDVQRAADAVESLVTDGLDQTQTRYNS